MVYGARLESVLGSRPHEFESRILRQRSFGPSFKALFSCHYCRYFAVFQLFSSFFDYPFSSVWDR